MVTDPYSATAFSDASRGGSTLVWMSPQNATIGSPTTTDGGFLPGLSTHWLAGAGFAPGAPIPDAATIVSLKAVVRHRLTSTGTAPCPAILSAAQSGTLSLTPNRAVPSAFEDYEIDLSGLLPLTSAQVNAGLPLRIAYDAVPTTPTDLSAAHYSITVSPAGLQTFASRGAISKTQAFVVTVAYTGTGTPAPRALVTLTGQVDGYGQGGTGPGGTDYVTGYSGTASVDDGIGDTDAGPISSGGGSLDPTTPSARGASGTHQVSVALGTPYVVMMAASVSVTPSDTQDAIARFTLTAGAIAPQDYDPSTVEVESVYMVASYTNPSPPPPPPASIAPYLPNLSRIPPLRPTTPTIR